MKLEGLAPISVAVPLDTKSMGPHQNTNENTTENSQRIELLEAQLDNYLRNVFGLKPQRKIAVLLSGGVDSSVVLACLKRYGCQNLSAYYLKIWFEDDAQFLGDCPWEEDLEYAATVCEQLDVPLHVLPMQQEYYRHVVEYTLDELRSGRTPSPDLFCNQFVKFGAFWDYLCGTASQQNAQDTQNPFDSSFLLASGHYALLLPFGSRILLQQATDVVKDQSYFLSRLSQQQLQQLLFPLGCLEKSEVRCLAKAWGLATAQRKDSQGICFLGKVKFRDFARHYLGQNPGPIVDIDGGGSGELGRHQGLWFHTIGQRQGLGLGGGPWYVCAKDMEHNILYVRHADCQQKYAAQQVCRFLVSQLTWLQSCETWQQLRQVSQKAPVALSSRGTGTGTSMGTDTSTGTLQLKLRHGPVKIPCSLEYVEDSQNSGNLGDSGSPPDLGVSSGNESGSGKWRVIMASSDRGVAPGQFAVFYWGNICLGSASILYPEFDAIDGKISDHGA